MAEPEVDAAWRAEFERVGEGDDRGSLSRETNRQPVFRWLGDKAEVQRLREERAHHYLRWTFLAVAAAVIVGLIAFGLTFLH
jgi:hypothetical protein